MKDQPRNAESLIRATTIERNVMQDFLRNIGMIEPEIHGTIKESEFCAILFHSWLVTECIYFTRIHSGHTKKQLYYPDEVFYSHNKH
jgi:hypothetical protein